MLRIDVLEVRVSEQRAQKKEQEARRLRAEWNRATWRRIQLEQECDAGAPSFERLDQARADEAEARFAFFAWTWVSA